MQDTVLIDATCHFNCSKGCMDTVLDFRRGGIYSSHVKSVPLPPILPPSHVDTRHALTEAHCNSETAAIQFMQQTDLKLFLRWLNCIIVAVPLH